MKNFWREKTEDNTMGCLTEMKKPFSPNDRHIKYVGLGKAAKKKHITVDFNSTTVIKKACKGFEFPMQADSYLVCFFCSSLRKKDPLMFR